MGEIVRLQRYISMSGAASRRHAEEMITEGRVSVNGEIVRTLGTKVEIGACRVLLDGNEIKPTVKKYYIMLNKPEGYICSVSDQFDRPTVTDIVKEEIPNVSLYPVGRLDYDTSGLLILTNDGDFTYKVTHPKHNVGKTYIAVLKGAVTISHLALLRKGIKVEDYYTSPAEVDLLDSYPGRSVVKITIHEGKNRQVRKMFDTLGYKVVSLHREAIGKVNLGNLPYGRWRHLTSVEVSLLSNL